MRHELSAQQQRSERANAGERRRCPQPRFALGGKVKDDAGAISDREPGQ